MHPSQNLTLKYRSIRHKSSVVLRLLYFTVKFLKKSKQKQNLLINASSKKGYFHRKDNVRVRDNLDDASFCCKQMVVW